MDAAMDTDLHNHDFMEMVYVTQGRAIHTLNSKETLICEGDYFIIDYGAYHKYTKISDCDYEIINVLFKPEFIDKSLIGCKSFRDLINNYTIKFSYTALQHDPTDIIYKDDNGLIYLLIQKLQDEYFNKGAGYLELMRCFLIEVIISTMRKIKKGTALPLIMIALNSSLIILIITLKSNLPWAGLGTSLITACLTFPENLKRIPGFLLSGICRKKGLSKAAGCC
jgi:hypothetical protein